jgi:hypothetical protein
MDLSRFTIVTEETAGFDMEHLLPVSDDVYKVLQKKLKLAGLAEKDVLFNINNKLHVFFCSNGAVKNKKTARKLRVYEIMVIHDEACLLSDKEWRFICFSKSEVETFKETFRKVDPECKFDVFDWYIVDPKTVEND